MVSILRQRDYALVWLATLISRSGDVVLIAALPYVVYALSGSTLASGLVLAAETIPRVLCSAIGGVVADRCRRKPILVAADLLRALLLVPLSAVHAPATLWIVYAVGCGAAAVGQIAAPVARACVPHLVARGDLAAANAALSVANWIAVLVGAPLGAVILQHGGLGGVALVDALTFAASALLVGQVRGRLEVRRRADRLHAGRPSTLGGVWDEWLGGLHDVLQVRWVTVYFLVALLAAVGNSVILVLLAPFVRHVLHAPAVVYAWLLVAQGLGGIASSLGVGRLTARITPPLLLGVSLLSLGVLEVVVASAAALPVTLAGTALGGSCILVLVVSQDTLLQSRIPESHRGRVFGVQFMLAAPLGLCGALLAGLLGDATSVRSAFALGGAFFIVAGAIGIAVLTPAVWQAAEAPSPH